MLGFGVFLNPRWAGSKQKPKAKAKAKIKRTPWLIWVDI